MRVIFSRKGFDSSYGGQPSPILPDGTMLSLPIPSPGDAVTYADLHHGGVSFDRYIHSLKSKPKVDGRTKCHLDPDLRADVTRRMDGWRPAFGQIGAAQRHLRNQKVGIGDLFLFFGWFRETRETPWGLEYAGPASGFHAIYGYLQVGEIIDSRDNVPEWLRAHPHAASESRWLRGNNTLYVASDELSLLPNMPGAGLFNFHSGLKLTKEGCCRSVRSLPEFFRKYSHLLQCVCLVYENDVVIRQNFGKCFAIHTQCITFAYTKHLHHGTGSTFNEGR